MAILTRNTFWFLAGMIAAGLILGFLSVFLWKDVDADFAHQPATAFSNTMVRYVVAAFVQTAIFALGLLAARLLFSQRVPDSPTTARILGMALVVLNYVLSVTVRKVFDQYYDLAALVYLLIVPLVSAFFYSGLARRLQGQPNQGVETG